MNKIWLYLVLLSSLVIIYTKPDMLLPNMMNSATNVVKLCLEFCAIYSVWLGLLEILDASGLSEKISHFLTPAVKKLFKTQNKEAIKQISISLSANFLGLGNAAIPSAIKAMQLLDEQTGRLNHPMFIFMIISSCSIQLLSTTIISLRTKANSAAPYDIILPTILTSLITALIVISLGALYAKRKYKSKVKK